ncbi:MAG: 2-hydroxychromene-2-carboxylate isomerase [Betaproteobacteria bacterium]|nr:2-hydroxychromene-2-carboxylate isomerase [Betaproteobacteria bacterium]MDH4326612.1 2-hydroxychromene-2-carboxylate isomerase [Betaproteobacteria bacterium]
MRALTLYFDFISPFSYIAFKRLHELPGDVEVRLEPVLFAGILHHHGQKGPAEIPAKRLWSYRWCTWWAKELGILFRFPASHPFNPLHHLRLALAAGPNRENVGRIFDAIWTTGAEASDPTTFKALAKELGVDESRLASPEVKDALRKNTEAAIARGVFGVPTYEVDGELFWGADALGFVNAFLADPAVLKNAEMRRVDSLPVGAARKT